MSCYFTRASFAFDVTSNTGTRVKRQEWETYPEKGRAVEVMLKDLLSRVSGAGNAGSVQKG